MQNIKIPEKRRDFGFEEVSFEEHRHRVGTLFNSVSNNYDLMNDLMSLGLHRYWKNTFVQRINPKPENEDIRYCSGNRGYLDPNFRKAYENFKITADACIR